VKIIFLSDDVDILFGRVALAARMATKVLTLEFHSLRNCVVEESQLSVISYQLSVNSYQSTAISYWLLVIWYLVFGKLLHLNWGMAHFRQSH
jgi:hypothetical protein